MKNAQPGLRVRWMPLNSMRCNHGGFGGVLRVAVPFLNPRSPAMNASSICGISVAASPVSPGACEGQLDTLGLRQRPQPQLLGRAHRIAPRWKNNGWYGRSTRSRFTMMRTGRPGRSVNVGWMFMLRRVISWPTWFTLSCKLPCPAMMTRLPSCRFCGAASSAPTPSSVVRAAPAKTRSQCQSTPSSRPA
ncbi:hypothetical protein G6F66_014286 [Rhizopus arrhizus]|nr:hypothetical protein G6F66_014286 [Rhizopus arrhizus]